MLCTLSCMSLNTTSRKLYIKELYQYLKNKKNIVWNNIFCNNEILPILNSAGYVIPL